LALFVFAAGIIAVVFYILTLSRALSKCSVERRTIQPGTLWILLVPLVNLVWDFIVVLGMVKSLGNEFRARNAHDVEPEPGKSIGIAMAVCAVCAVIPIVGIIAGIAYLVLWIFYWMKMADFSRKLDTSSATGGLPLIPGIVGAP
jgi:cobalamin synthase